MNALTRLFVFMLLCASSASEARLPESKGESSLLYWRYLCRGQVQKETVSGQMRELSCPSQGWRVRAHESQGRVREVFFHDT